MCPRDYVESILGIVILNSWLLSISKSNNSNPPKPNKPGLLVGSAGTRNLRIEVLETELAMECFFGTWAPFY